MLSIAYSPDSNTLACAVEDKLELWAPHTEKRLKTIAVPNMNFFSVVYLADGQTIASTGGLNFFGRQVRLWDVQTGRFMGSFAGHTRHITS